MNLRPYQQQAIRDVYSQINKRINRNLIYLATGSGKSVIFKKIAHDAISKGKKICFVVYGVSIVDQAARKHFSEITDSICMIMGPNKYKHGKSLYCCSISTISRSADLIGKLIDDCDLFIIDEAHNATSDSYKMFLESIPEHKPVIGLTATPFYIGNRGHSFWEYVTHPVTTLDLVKLGHLYKPKVFSPPIDFITDGVRTTAGDYNNKQLFEANDKATIYSDVIKTWKKFADGLRTIGFCINKEHAFNFCTLFNDAGIPSAYADADTPQDERLDLISRLEKKELLALFNVNIFSTGVDIPLLECGLMLRPTKSLPLWIQQVGRILRTHPEKQNCMILDCVGNTRKIGHPLMDFSADLEDKKPRSVTSLSEQELKTKDCPNCFYITSAQAKTCLNCDHVFVSKKQEIIEIKEVDLIEVHVGETISWASKYIRPNCPRDVRDKIEAIAKNIAVKQWKKNSFFFKVRENKELNEWIHYPNWFEKISTQNTKSSSSELDSRFSQNLKRQFFPAM